MDLRSELLPLGEVYRIYDPQTGVAEGVRRRRQAFSDNRGVGEE